MNADSLQLSVDERRALRAAGLVAADIAQMVALGIVVATDDDIGEARAKELVGRAELLELGVHVSALAEIGVRCRADLDGRRPEDMWIQLVEETARTHPHYYDMFCQAAYVAAEGPDRGTTVLMSVALCTAIGWMPCSADR